MALQEVDGSYAVQVLGPLRASLDGEELDLGGPKQQLLLALLLTDRDRVVTREHLIDGLWADDPPATAKKALQVHVSNLRRAIGDEFPLRTAPGGYLIQSAGIELDATAFEELVTKGTALLRTNPSAACRTLEDALALWSGPAYSNVADAEPLSGEVARLNELRLRATTSRLDGELRLGHHADVIGELDTLTTDHAYDEQLRALHMVALYRSGRQTDALRSYQRTRTILRDELGIEPSPELRALERQILEHSNELDLEDLGEGEHCAFLATDLVASTPMWEAEPELMQRALARHDEILHHAVDANAGKVFQGTGDGVYAVFAGIADAAQAAVDAQRALDAEAWPTTQPLRVRMGVDQGPAEARGGDYFGPALNRVSRVMSSGHGQQVLIPTVLAGAISLPTRDLGAADYKGIGRVDVSQIDIDGLPVEFPDLQTDRAPAVQPRQGFGHGIRGYELRERLGEGAHGIVYRAYQASVGREVAVKAIRPEFANQPEFIKRFEAEAQYVAQLEHPHIVSLYDYWRDPEGAYLAMQWLRGGSLAKALERAPWRPPAALHLIDQIGGALTYAHRHGVIHRDLKPANVLLDDDGNAFLSDFGIATDHVEAPTGPVTSSVAYVSPEELAGDPVGVAADVYGLALLTYEILTGERPPLGAQPASAVALRPELPATLDEVLARATHVDPTLRYARIDDFVRALRQAFGVDVVDGRVASDAEVRNPYKGLRAFAETDARDFHGREALVQQLLQQVSASPITAVVGPSGSGKSSLVRAGLLPAIRRGELAPTGDTLITEMFPGSFPFEELEAAVLRVAVDRPDDLLSDLVADDRGLLRVSKQILPHDDSELLLVIDQFEEIFSLTTDDDVRRKFIDALVTVGHDDRSRVRVVLTIRADFFDRPLEYPEFGALISSGLVTVAMPSDDELAVAISQPARNAGLDLEPGLVATITHDVADEPGALPLLQYALTELVEGRDGPLLTIDAYNRTGGVAGAVSRRAEEIYNGLPDSACHVAHQVFLRLVAVDRDVDDTRRRVRRVELESLGLNETALDTVLSEFGAFRLLSFDRDPVTRGPTIEVAHEALIREWPRYRDWIDERREDLLLERRLDHATTEWLANERDPSFLFTAGRLEHFERWADGGDIRITESEREYLDAARAAADVAEHQRSSRRRRTLAIVSTLAVAAVALAIVALIQRDRANDEAATADAQAALAAEESQRAGDAAAAADALRAEAERQAAIESARSLAIQAESQVGEDPQLAMLLAVAAHETALGVGVELPEIMSALSESTRGNRIVSRFSLDSKFAVIGVDVDVSPDGTRAVVPQGNGDYLTPYDSADVIDLDTGALLVRIEDTEPIMSVGWDQSRDEVITGGAQGTISYWDPDSGELLRADVGGQRPIGFLSAHDGVAAYSLLNAIETGLHTAVVMDQVTGERLLEQDDALGVLVSPNGAYGTVHRLDGTVSIHDLRAGEETGTVRDGRFGISVSSVTFVPGEDAVWLAGGDRSLARIDLATATITEVTTTTGLGVLPTSLAASPDGRWLAVGDADTTVRIYDTASYTERLALQGHQGPVDLIEWAPDSEHLVSIEPGNALTWSLNEELRFADVAWFASPGQPVVHGDLGSGRFVIGGGGSLQTWDRGAEEPLDDFPLPAGTNALDATSINEELGLVARSTGAGIQYYDARANSVVLDADAGADSLLRLSPDGRYLAASSTGFTASSSVTNEPVISLIDVESGRLHHWASGDTASGAVFTADSEIVIYLEEDLDDAGLVLGATSLVAYDVADFSEVSRLELDFTAHLIELSPTGERFAVAGSTAGEIALFDLARFLDDPASSLIDRTEAVSAQNGFEGLAFSDDGSALLAGGFDQRVSAWSTTDGLEQLWSIDHGTPVFRLRVLDGLVWLGDFSELDNPAGADLVGGLVALPIEQAAFADFARTRIVRDFTEAECQDFFGSACADRPSNGS